MKLKLQGLKILTLINAIVLVFCFFLTTGCLKKPTITTSEITNITTITASGGGNVTTDESAPIAFRGICWGTTPNPSIYESKTYNGTGSGNFVSSLDGLLIGKTYYVRAYAINRRGVFYGNQVIFKTIPDTLVDIDGNNYKVVQVGDIVWMAENLKTTRYSNGDSIVTFTPPFDPTCKYKWAYEYDERNVPAYGWLYSWYTSTDSRNICPTGWHVASDSDWHKLALAVDSNANYSQIESQIGGGKLKEAGTMHWQNPNEGAINALGFRALPGGAMDHIPSFEGIGTYGFWWTSTDSTMSYAIFRSMQYYNAFLIRSINHKCNGFSIRCVKD
jgi:uncharacterized protein (TIGR02145 family)